MDRVRLVLGIMAAMMIALPWYPVSQLASIGSPPNSLLLPAATVPGVLPERLFRTTANTVTSVSEPNDFLADTWERHPFQDTIDEFHTLQPGDAEELLWNGTGNRTFRDEFDVNEYFSVLPHVSMAEGYLLDYVYLTDGDYNCSRPVIYARETEREPYIDFTGFIEGEGYQQVVDITPFFIELLTHGATLGWPQKIEIEDTEQGFMEYLLLSTTAGRFHLYGIAHYDDMVMVCDTRGLQAVAEREPFLLENDADFVNALNCCCEEDLAPRVYFQPEYVFVSAVFFTKWGGLVRGHFLMKRQFPHEGIRADWRILVPYDCGIVLEGHILTAEHTTGT